MVTRRNLRLLLSAVFLILHLRLSHSFTFITFDVDGTLVRGSGQAADQSAHARAFSYACGKVLGNGTPTEDVAKALPRSLFHGSTDGLIMLRLARATLNVEPKIAMKKLNELMDTMYDYISDLNDAEVAAGISTLPGVIDNLLILSSMKDTVACGLVTGNVEGIARRKMQAVGILKTGALSSASQEQLQQRNWPGSEDIGFLGGFGSDYCSGNIDDVKYNHLDRAEQIAIAVKRCQQKLQLQNGDENKGGTKTKTGGNETLLQRVVHVGDAPADVLAAKSYAERVAKDGAIDICVGMVAVATGSYSADELQKLAGEPIPGQWEPVVLENGMADADFLKACGLKT